MRRICILVLFLLFLVVQLVFYIDRSYNTIPSGLNLLPDKRAKLNVILLSYQRSGSTYTGELLSSGDGCSYFFEPLYVEQSDFRANLAGIFSCNSLILNRLRNSTFRIVRKFGRSYDPDNFYNFSDVVVRDYCLRDRMSVVKTIRLRIADVVPLLDQFSNLKIIHLVRDPRGVVHSIYKLPDYWPDNLRDPVTLCANMAKDIEEGKKLPKHRYYLVRYENLVRRPFEQGEKIFRFLDQPFSNLSKRYLREHGEHRINRIRKSYVNDYYSTFRNSTFDPFAWKTNMTAQRRLYLDAVCMDALIKLEKLEFNDKIV